MAKKYIMKNEKIAYSDGTSNDEYIRDIISEIEVLFGNIQDNCDLCMQLYNIRKNDDEDLADALQIACENLVAIEKDAGEIISVVDQVKENIKKYNKENQEDFENLLKQMRGYEKKSKKIMEANLI